MLNRFNHNYLVLSFYIGSYHKVLSHGNLVLPYSWADYNKDGWYFSTSGTDNKIGCGTTDAPQNNEYTQTRNRQPDCLNMWFSNNVTIPGEMAIPAEYQQSDVECIAQDGQKDKWEKFPFAAPGTAPVFDSCGTEGGNPFGCYYHQTGEFKDKFGDCCGDSCDSYAMGKGASNITWPNAPTTKWQIGSAQEVAFYIGPNHAGAYAYRLCKIKKDKELTEECFNKNHLDFFGENQWVVYQKDKKTRKRTELVAQRLVTGTYPKGSMWSLNPILPMNEAGGSADYGHGHIIDYVKVPDLDAGNYVLSLRWDCKCSAQVWNFCANIEIFN